MRHSSSYSPRAVPQTKAAARPSLEGPAPALGLIFTARSESYIVGHDSGPLRGVHVQLVLYGIGGFPSAELRPSQHRAELDSIEKIPIVRPLSAYILSGLCHF